MITKFSYATLIHPRNGQELVAFPAGIELDPRTWTAKDAGRYPQAARQLDEGQCLVIDADTRLVYAVEQRRMGR